GIISTAMISKKSVIVVCTPFTSVCRSWLMSLIITFMFEPAKLQMNCASASGAMNARAEPTQLAVANPVCLGVALTLGRRYGRPRRAASPEADEGGSNQTAAGDAASTESNCS